MFKLPVIPLPPDMYFTTREVAAICGTSTETVKRWRQAGFLKAVPLGYRTFRYAGPEVQKMRDSFNKKTQRLSQRLTTYGYRTKMDVSLR
jgi:predicted site-specific integrase-resolvase